MRALSRAQISAWQLKKNIWIYPLYNSYTAFRKVFCDCGDVCVPQMSARHTHLHIFNFKIYTLLQIKKIV